MRRLLQHFERYATLYALSGFALGALAGGLFSFAAPLEALLDLIVDSYATVAPVMIFFVLAPSLLSIAEQYRWDGVHFSAYTVFWFARLRVFACLFAIVLVSLVYALPLTNAGSGSVVGSLSASLGTLGRMLLTSPYFLAMYASVLTAAVLWRSERRWVKRFATLPELIEKLGELLTLVVPLFTLLVGIYVSTLPSVLRDHFQDYPVSTFGEVTVLGLRFDPTRPGGILAAYLAVSLTTGLICALWHCVLLGYVRSQIPGFSLRKYFFEYFSRLYPLLWATSSEVLATPLNMHLIKKLYPSIDPRVRRFAVGIGSVININGTLTCCFVMTPAVAQMLGIEISVITLLLCFPVIFIIGFGVPGIPGELVLFAGPIMTVLAVPEPLQPAFLLTFIGLQIGLPDSFRTGANSTDEAPASLLLNAVFERRFPESAAANLVPEPAIVRQSPICPPPGEPCQEEVP